MMNSDIGVGVGKGMGSVGVGTGEWWGRAEYLFAYPLHLVGWIWR